MKLDCILLSLTIYFTELVLFVIIICPVSESLPALLTMKGIKIMYRDKNNDKTSLRESYHDKTIFIMFCCCYCCF